MNVANLELCKVLYELSGWSDIDAPSHYTKDHKFVCSLYTLGYLLDKLVEVKTGLTLYHVHSTMNWEAFYAGKFFEYGTDTQHWETQDENPANAVAKLAIELLKSGVLTSEHSGSSELAQLTEGEQAK